MDSPLHRVLDGKGRQVERIDASATVIAAVGLMNDRNLGSVVVFDGETLVGIFTERDVLVRVVGARRDPTTLRVREVMTSKLFTVEPTTTVEQALALMSTVPCRHLPVVEDGRVVGLVSQGDLTRWVIRDQARAIVDLTDYIHHA